MELLCIILGAATLAGWIIKVIVYLDEGVERHGTD
jgi:hypothetical protein